MMINTVAVMGAAALAMTVIGESVAAPVEFADQDLIDEFNDASTGIAVSMIAAETWANPGTSHSGMDSAGFFERPPMEYKPQQQQAMTLVSRAQPMTMYGAYGAYGLAFHITEKSFFWKYFQVYACGFTHEISDADRVAGRGACGCYNVGTPPVWTCYHETGCWKCQNDTVVGGLGDGMTAPPRADCRVVMEKAGKDYTWFRDQKNKILSLFDTAYHSGHDYNEFDTNGLSSTDLAGVFYSEVNQDIHPQSDQTLCNFLMKVNPERKTPWPVYTYKWGTLSIKKHLQCPPAGLGAAGLATTVIGQSVAAPVESTDQDLIDEFNDASTGIAVSMIAAETWANPGTSHSGMDSAGFFERPPMEYKPQQQQAMTLVSRAQPMTMYGAYGAYGLAFHITEKTLFWKYFQVYACGFTNEISDADRVAGRGACGCYNVGTPPVWTCYHETGCWKCQNDTVVGGLGDGMTAPPRADCRVVMEKAGKDYTWFRDQKNKILSLFDTAYHSGHDYNEFDTNGLSSTDLAGVFYSEVNQDIHPQSDQTLCNFLMKVNPERKTPWPIYTYKWGTLSIKKYLQCPPAGTHSPIYF